ncbi:MAG: hypothetical protein KJ906_00425 [Nanoarchaeota archaeon]|nr:hypothetical protein [Nanoarchaeota archaeon]
MPTIGIATNILAPAGSKTVQYVGPRPGRIFKLIPDMIKTTMGISSGSFWEDEIRWDASSNPVSFYGLWRGKKGLDALTKLWFEVEVRGTQDSKTKDGDISLKLKGKIETKVGYKTIIDKGLILVYQRMFYKNQRLNYIEEANRKIQILEDMIREEFNLMRKEQ